MRVTRVWYNRLKPKVEQHGYATESYDRHSDAQRLCSLANSEGFVAEISGGYVRVATKRVVQLSEGR